MRNLIIGTYSNDINSDINRRNDATLDTLFGGLLGGFMGEKDRRELSRLLSPMTAAVLFVWRIMVYIAEPFVNLRSNMVEARRQREELRAYRASLLNPPVKLPWIPTPCEEASQPVLRIEKPVQRKEKRKNSRKASNVYSALSYRDLQIACKERGIKAVGKKEELIDRLTKDDRGQIRKASNKGK